VESLDPDDASIGPKVQATASTISNTAVAGSMQMGSSVAADTTQAEEDRPSSSNSGGSDDGNCLPISASEAQEVAFQRAWLAYMWSRAASLGVEPHLSKERAEHWGHLLQWGSASPPAPRHTDDSPFAAAMRSQAAVSSGVAGAMSLHLQPGGPAAMAHAKELMEVHAGLQELARLGVEQQVWVRRTRT